MENRLVIPIGKNKIVAEITDWQDGMPNELVVYLCDDNDAVFQDICLVREHYDYNRNSEEFEVDSDFVDCIVWGESGNDDYTNKHVIGVYDEEV